MKKAIVVGCGLSGAVVARQLAEADYSVTILERRNHIAGNMYDYVDQHGFLVHKYGPHTFHTKKKKLYDYMCRFGKWQEFKLTCGAEIDGKCTPTPFNFQTIDDFYTRTKAIELKEHIRIAFGDRKTATVVEMLEHPDVIIREFAEFLFDKDYSLYTAKQWGVSPKEIDPSVLKRVPIRFSYDVGYFDDEYQVMPTVSYTEWFKKILNHTNITVHLGIDALQHIEIKDNELLFDGKRSDIPVIYTGALDELFKHKYGALPYRSLIFEWKYSDKESYQDMPVVAYPQAKKYTRITEYKKLPIQNKNGTSYAIEYPIIHEYKSGSEPYYPVLTERSKEQYTRYRALAKKVKKLYLCGRLADFKYFNMDQALERALEIASIIMH